MLKKTSNPDFNKGSEKSFKKMSIDHKTLTFTECSISIYQLVCCKTSEKQTGCRLQLGIDRSQVRKYTPQQGRAEANVAKQLAVSTRTRRFGKFSVLWRNLLSLCQHEDWYLLYMSMLGCINSTLSIWRVVSMSAGNYAKDLFTLIMLIYRQIEIV